MKEEFSNYLTIMNEAISRDDFNAYDVAKDMLDEAIDEYRHEKALAKEAQTRNFGILNHIFEERLPELLKTDKKAVRDVIKTIKEDKNLMNEFKFYSLIKNYNGNVAGFMTPEEMIAGLNENFGNEFVGKEILKSNDKLRKVMTENHIIPTSFVEYEDKKLYESIHKLLTKEKNLSNFIEISECVKYITNYLDKHKDDAVEESVDPDKMIKEFEEKLKETLTESEMSFVKDITDFKSPIAEQRKEKLFNKLKTECIDKINSMLKEDSNNEELKGLKKQIEEQKFNKDSIIKDVAKLLEIRDILMDD